MTPGVNRCVHAPRRSSERLRLRVRCVIDQGMNSLRTLTGINTSQRSPEGWIPLPLILRGLTEAQRIAVRVGDDRYLIGHAVHSGMRWWMVPDWLAKAVDLPKFES
jgi:hypothetical protein